MQMEPGPLPQPLLPLAPLMDAVVINDQMAVHMAGHIPLNLLQEGEKLGDVAGDPCTAPARCPWRHPGQQTRLPAVVTMAMDDTFHRTRFQGQRGLGSLQCLELPLPAYAERDGVSRWIGTGPITCCTVSPK